MTASFGREAWLRGRGVGLVGQVRVTGVVREWGACKGSRDGFQVSGMGVRL